MDRQKTSKLKLLVKYQGSLNLSDLELGQIISCPSHDDRQYILNAYYRKYIKQKKGGYNRDPSITRASLVLLEVLTRLDSLGYPIKSVWPDLSSGSIDRDCWNGEANQVLRQLKNFRGVKGLPVANRIIGATMKYLDIGPVQMSNIFFEINNKENASKRITRILSSLTVSKVKCFDVFMCHVISFAHSRGVNILECYDVVESNIKEAC